MLQWLMHQQVRKQCLDLLRAVSQPINATLLPHCNEQCLTWEEGQRKQVLRQRVPERVVVHAGAPCQVKRPDLRRLQPLLLTLLRGWAWGRHQAAPQAQCSAAAQSSAAAAR